MSPVTDYQKNNILSGYSDAFYECTPYISKILFDSSIVDY